MQAGQAPFAQRGIDLVSSREILALAKQRNQSAVQYHFGSRNGLVQAAFLKRFKKIDRMRGARLSLFELRGRFAGRTINVHPSRIDPGLLRPGPLRATGPRGRAAGRIRIDGDRTLRADDGPSENSHLLGLRKS